MKEMTGMTGMTGMTEESSSFIPAFRHPGILLSLASCHPVIHSSIHPFIHHFFHPFIHPVILSSCHSCHPIIPVIPGILSFLSSYYSWHSCHSLCPADIYFCGNTGQFHIISCPIDLQYIFMIQFQFGTAEYY